MSSNQKLWAALATDSVSAVSHSLQNGADPNSVRNGTSALKIACRSGKKKMVLALLEAGADPSKLEPDGRNSPLHVAVCSFRRSKVVQKLIDRGGDPNGKDDEGITPLMLACKNGTEEVIMCLLRNNVQVIARDDADRTVLHWLMIGRDNPELVNILIEMGVDPLAQSDQGLSSIDYAKELGRVNSINAMKFIQIEDER